MTNDRNHQTITSAVAIPIWISSTSWYWPLKYQALSWGWSFNALATAFVSRVVMLISPFSSGEADLILHILSKGYQPTDIHLDDARSPEQMPGDYSSSACNSSCAYLSILHHSQPLTSILKDCWATFRRLVWKCLWFIVFHIPSGNTAIASRSWNQGNIISFFLSNLTGQEEWWKIRPCWLFPTELELSCQQFFSLIPGAASAGGFLVFRLL